MLNDVYILMFNDFYRGWSDYNILQLFLELQTAGKGESRRSRRLCGETRPTTELGWWGLGWPKGWA